MNFNTNHKGRNMERFEEVMKKLGMRLTERRDVVYYEPIRKWRVTEHDLNLLRATGQSTRTKNKNTKFIRTPDGVFESARAAAEHYKITDNAVRSKVYKKQWEYLDEFETI